MLVSCTFGARNQASFLTLYQIFGFRGGFHQPIRRLEGLSTYLSSLGKVTQWSLDVAGMGYMPKTHAAKGLPPLASSFLVVPSPS